MGRLDIYLNKLESVEYTEALVDKRVEMSGKQNRDT